MFDALGSFWGGSGKMCVLREVMATLNAGGMK